MKNSHYGYFLQSLSAICNYYIIAIRLTFLFANKFNNKLCIKQNKIAMFEFPFQMLRKAKTKEKEINQ